MDPWFVLAAPITLNNTAQLPHTELPPRFLLTFSDICSRLCGVCQHPVQKVNHWAGGDPDIDKSDRQMPLTSRPRGLGSAGLKGCTLGSITS